MSVVRCTVCERACVDALVSRRDGVRVVACGPECAGWYDARYPERPLPSAPMPWTWEPDAARTIGARASA